MNGNDSVAPIPGGYATVTQYQPGIGEYLTTVQVSTTGITKRELFAAMAMQGLLSDSEVDSSSKQIVRAAVLNADNLIEELNKKEETK